MTMTQRINALLAEKGIGKYQFYSDCGITSGTFSLWANGKTKPLTKNVQIIADYLNTTTEYLLTGEGQKEKPPVNDKGLTDAQQTVLTLFDAMTEQEQRALLATAKGLIASRQAKDSF